MAKKTIITAALTGAWPKKENNPNVPMTPSEIADDIYACWKAGSSNCTSTYERVMATVQWIRKI